MRLLRATGHTPSAVALCQNYGQFEWGGPLDAEPEGDRGLTNRLILISNATRALSESCQNGLSQTHS